MAQAWAAGMARSRERFMATGLFARDELDFAAIAARGIPLEGGASLVYLTMLMPRGAGGCASVLNSPRSRAGAAPPQPPA